MTPCKHRTAGLVTMQLASCVYCANEELRQRNDELKSDIADIRMEREAWHTAHDEQVTLLNQIATELDRYNTLCKGQHVELYNARLELDALKHKAAI